MSIKNIYFYCYPLGPAEKAGYQHETICLAEGLKEIDISFYADRNYWKNSLEEGDYLFSYNKDVSPDDCDVVILNSAWVDYGYPLPRNLFKKNRKYILVYFDFSDYLITPGWGKEFRNFDIVFKAHYNTKFNNPKNFYPWQFGLNNRILNQVKDYLEFSNRKDSILTNFRIGHSLREYIKQNLLPTINDTFLEDFTTESFENYPKEELDYLYWVQSGRRHYPSYYKRLMESKVCACFGGSLINKFETNGILRNKFIKKLDDKIFHFKKDIIYQYDSFRFWESLSAGCVSLHVDFEKYGVKLPVMPENNKHYIGVDLDNIQSVREILNNESMLRDISISGREWAINNFAPKPTAERFMKLISSL